MREGRGSLTGRGRAWLIAAACLVAVALPTGAAAGVRSPDFDPTIDGLGSSGRLTASSHLRRGDCFSRNVIDFAGTLLYRVRHHGLLRCEGMPLQRVSCYSRLFEVRGGSMRAISTLESHGRSRCSVASQFDDSALYLAGERFREVLRYRLTLRRGFRYLGPDEFCSELSANRRTLTCRDSHGTSAPNRHQVEHD